jgi:hypothetical protein
MVQIRYVFRSKSKRNSKPVSELNHGRRSVLDILELPDELEPKLIVMALLAPFR